MLIKNIYQEKRETIYECHYGIGQMDFSRIMASNDFETSIDFIDYAIIPPGSSIGYHQHLDNEELYLVLKGTGKMRVNDEELDVIPGDLIVNQNNSFHGLKNCSNEEIHIFVIQVANKNSNNINLLLCPDEVSSDHYTTMGIDIGATFTKVAEYSDNTIINFYQESTPKFKSNNELLNFIENIINQSKTSVSELRALGIGLCGMVNQIEGIYKTSVLFPNIENMPIVKMLNEGLGIPVFIDNDSNLAAIGEYAVGIAKGSKVLIAITLGTGVGAGIVINGKPFYGSHGYAGEFGHLIIDTQGPRCFCGNKGCLNMLSSATALSDYYKLYTNSIADIDITSNTIIDMVNSNDITATKVFHQSCNYLGIAIANAITSFDPDAVVICGGLSNAGNIFIEEIRRSVKQYVLPELWNKTKIELSNLREKSGAVGAAIIAYEHAINNKKHEVI